MSKHLCDKCGKDNETLYCREGYRMGYAVEWVCKHCYKDTYGISWNVDYGESNGKIQIEAGSESLHERGVS